MRKILLIVLINVFFHLLVNGQESYFRFNGFLEADHISYSNNINNKINGRNEVQAFFDLKSNRDKKIYWNAKIEIREDLRNSKRNRFYLDEAVVRIPFKNTDISFGKQIFAWGTADGVNPTNNINAIDYSDLIDTKDESIGVMSILVQQYLKNINFKAVIVPQSKFCILPSANSRWYPELPEYIPNPFIPDSIIKVNYTEVDQFPDPSIENFEYALKSDFNIKSVDFSLSYFNGYDKTPTIKSEMGTLDVNKMEMLLVKNYNRQHVIGFDFSVILHQFGIKGESGLFLMQTEKEIQYYEKNYFKYIIGIDRNFYFSKNNLFMILQYTQDLPLENQDFDNTSLKHIFQNSLICKLDLNIGINFIFSQTGFYNFNTKDYYLQSKIKYQIFNGCNIIALVDILEGDKNSFFGQYGDNDRFQLKLKYNF